VSPFGYTLAVFVDDLPDRLCTVLNVGCQGSPAAKIYSKQRPYLEAEAMFGIGEVLQKDYIKGNSIHRI
jgi:hypothetical protein